MIKRLSLFFVCLFALSQSNQSFAGVLTEKPLTTKIAMGAVLVGSLTFMFDVLDVRDLLNSHWDKDSKEQLYDAVDAQQSLLFPASYLYGKIQEYLLTRKQGDHESLIDLYEGALAHAECVKQQEEAGTFKSSEKRWRPLNNGWKIEVAFRRTPYHPKTVTALILRLAKLKSAKMAAARNKSK